MQTQLSAPPDPIQPSSTELTAASLGSRPLVRVMLALLMLGPLLLAVLLVFPAYDRSMFHNPTGHLLITLTASIMGVVLALLVLHVARRAQDGRVFLVGLGLLSAASILITHSISTPSVVMSGRGTATSLSALLSLLFGSIFFALSGLNVTPALNRRLMRYARLWLLAYVIFWLAYNWLVLLALPAMSLTQAQAGTIAASAPGADRYGDEGYGAMAGDGYGSASGADPQAQPADDAGISPDAIIGDDLERDRALLIVAGLSCFAFAIVRHYRLYRRTPSQAGMGITFGMAFLAEALLTQGFAQIYVASFWLYHLQEFIGFGLMSYAVLGAYRRGQTGDNLLESLFLSTTRARLEAEYAQARDMLVDTLALGEAPGPALRKTLRERAGLTESQIQVLESAALAVAHERRQRQELERLNQTLRQLERHKRQLTQMIIHDLKNPLTATTGFLDLLRIDRLTDQQHLLLDGALRSTRTLAGLIDDLLDIERIEEGRLELSHSLFAPRELLEQCAEEMRGWLAQESKSLTIEAPPDLPLLQADLRLMRRVMLNLLSNAIKHTPLHTQIILRAAPFIAPPRADGEDSAHVCQVVIEVEDSGLGIPAERLERIFEKFGRFSSEPNPRQVSTGLGLTFCRLVVEEHGGSIGVSSVVGQGSTFRITLPTAEH